MSHGDPDREFTTAANGAEFHKLTDESVGETGEVVTPDNRARKVSAGDVLVKTDRPDVYNVYTKDEWNDMGVESASRVDDDEDEDTEETPQFHAWEHSAADVRAYLNDPAVSEEERARVRKEEEENGNRATALR